MATDTEDQERRKRLGPAYKGLVGYDPFEDDPSQKTDDVARLLAEVMALHAEAYTPEQVARIKELAGTIAGQAVPMAVVDYLGRRDADGEVTEASDLSRRFGTRDMRHVAIYDLRPCWLNQAAWGKPAMCLHENATHDGEGLRCPDCGLKRRD